jgi:hypothetical protein
VVLVVLVRLALLAEHLLTTLVVEVEPAVAMALKPVKAVLAVEEREEKMNLLLTRLLLEP